MPCSRTLLSAAFLCYATGAVACADHECPEGRTKVGTVCVRVQLSEDAGRSSEDPTATRIDGSIRGDLEDAQAAVGGETPRLHEDAGFGMDAIASSPGATDAGTADAACVALAETCNGRDDDCDGKVDEDVAEAPIGESCNAEPSSACAKTGTHVCFNGEIICSVSETVTPEACDGVDNDCNGKVDDGVTNGCGGTKCDLDTSNIGKVCTQGTGDCQNSGVWECDPTAENNALRCSVSEKPKTCAATGSCAPLPPENCATPEDDNCNGTANEGCCTQLTWFQDCDGDGFATSTAGAVVSCEKPQPLANCTGWTNVAPSPETKSNWDCNDNSAAYFPGADFGIPAAAGLSWDFDCNGVLTPKELTLSAEKTLNPDIWVCSAAVIDQLNISNQWFTTSTTTRASSGCVFWRDAAGRYTAEPPTKCADTEVYQFSVSSMPKPDLGGYLCSKERVDIGVWPCR